MNEKHILKIAEELNLSSRQVQATAGLLGEEATVPFIARYRKEITGSLDEVAVTSIRDRLIQLAELDKRQGAILKSLEERHQLTEDLNQKILEAETMADLEDIYLPYRPKRRTRATMAREKGLEPLAQKLFDQGDIDPPAEALAFVDSEKGVANVEEALSGARDIMAEWINEDQTARARMRSFYASRAVFKSRVVAEKEVQGIKYKDYYEWEEPAATVPSHRVLAIRRGEKEEFLNLRILPPEEEALELLTGLFVKKEGPAAEQVRMAVQESYKRLLSLSMETETRLEIKKRADEEAIRVFAENLRQLLLSPPLGQKRVLAIDPGFRTGGKVVCLDRQGQLLHHDTIFLLSQKGLAAAGETIQGLCGRFEIEVIAIGNGTAGRETETFIRGLALPSGIQVIMVNESGASVYSASEGAREEFPDQDVTVRGSVSIGRRLMDPLAELVKIDPKSIGVGQYQHDVDQNALKNSLDDVVVHCVNRVGVEVNTASRQLLAYVSGLGPGLARGIVEFRNHQGPFNSREDLKKVPRLGPKAFEQAAGFLRIREGNNPLDGSAVHPESYPLVGAMASDLGCSVIDLMSSETLREKIDINRYLSEKVGLPTLRDILTELAKPGRDPREEFEILRFADGLEKIEDVKPGMKLPGIVTNITAFGVFVDIGVHQDGLVHISELTDRFVKNPAEVVKVHQKVMVTVLDVDLPRKRIALSMKAAPTPSEKGKKGKEIKKENNKPEKTGKSRSTFSNSPFATLLGKENRRSR